MAFIIDNRKLRSAAFRRQQRRTLDKELVVELLCSGWSMSKIAAEMGCSNWPIQKIRKELKSSGIPL